MPSRTIIRCLGILVLVGAFGCAGDSRQSEETPPAGAYSDASPRRGGRVVIGVQQEPERLCEMLNSTATTELVANLIFSKFVKFNDKLDMVPDLLEYLPTKENGGISQDNLTYRYQLRKDAMWHDGQPVTSADVAFTYRLIVNPDVPTESREGWDVIDGVETPDDYTVVFHLKEPYPDFVGETFNNEAILPRHLLEDVPAKGFHTADYHRAPLGSGPFLFEEWVPGSHITVRRNGAYYGGAPYLDEITFRFLPDDNSLLMQLQTGEIDIYDNANLSFLETFERMSNVTVRSTPTLMYEHIDFNLDNPILSDRRVRQAIAFATNRAEIVDHVYKGKATAALLDEHPSSPYYSVKAAEAVRYDVDAARRLLREAGWVDSDGNGIADRNGEPLRLTISATAGNPDREKTEVVLQQQYRKVGLDLQIKNYNASVLYASWEDGGILKHGKFDIAMYAWLSSPEPASKKSLYGADDIPPKGQNNPRIRNAELTRLLEQGAREMDAHRRITIYRAASDILVEEAPVVPLFWYTTIDVCRSSIHNYRPNPTTSADTWNAHTWWVEPKGVDLSER